MFLQGIFARAVLAAMYRVAVRRSSGTTRAAAIRHALSLWERVRVRVRCAQEEHFLRHALTPALSQREREKSLLARAA
jgi:hypothetical protein